MPGWAQVNNEWRPLQREMVNVGGVMRPTRGKWVQVNGEWRPTMRDEENPDEPIIVDNTNIAGFRMVYKRMPSATHPDHPALSYNGDLPVYVAATGEASNEMDYRMKGIIFRYERKQPHEEGIVAYQGRLYAVTKSGLCVDLTYDGDQEIFRGLAPDMGYCKGPSVLGAVTITVGVRLMYESYGHHMSGWNGYFDTEHFLDTTPYIYKGPRDDSIADDSRPILPTEQRYGTFTPTAMIGIARDIHTEEDDMVGSYGRLDQTIYRITANKILKPFVVEVYD